MRRGLRWRHTARPWTRRAGAAADEADAQVRADGGKIAEVPTWGRRALRPWTETEDQEHAQLMGAVRTTATALRAGVADAGLNGGYEMAHGLHKAARGE